MLMAAVFFGGRELFHPFFHACPPASCYDSHCEDDCSEDEIDHDHSENSIPYSTLEKHSCPICSSAAKKSTAPFVLPAVKYVNFVQFYKLYKESCPQVHVSYANSRAPPHHC